MSTSSTSLVPQDAPYSDLAPLSILRTETVLSRFPIHNLSKRGPVTIHIHQTTAQGALDYHWEVSYNVRYGQPGPLAYKLDTLVINQCLAALPRPLPRLLKVGSLRQIAARLGVNSSGRQQGHLKTAFHQNASAYIVAWVRYRSREGTARRLDAGFTRYSVLFTGDPLPDGTVADAVYLVLSEPYVDVLTHALVRPLDYAYLRELTPTAQRFYELLSYKMFVVLRQHRPHATLRYSDYCLFAPQPRYLTYDQVKKQLYKVHQPHLQAGYLMQVRYEATRDAAGQPDWFLHYTPGAKARTEFVAFSQRADHAAPGEDGQADRVVMEVQEPQATLPPPPLATRLVVRDAKAQPPPQTITLPPDATDPLVVKAHALVRAFYQRFHGLTQVTALPKELDHARQLLREYGEAKAHFLLTYAQQAAPDTHYCPRTFMGILHYLPHALAAYDVRTAQATYMRTQKAAACEQRWHERYLTWQQEQFARRRAAMPAETLRALEDAQRTRLIAAGTAPVALDFAVRYAVDNILVAQDPLPPFAVWRQQQEKRHAYTPT